MSRYETVNDKSARQRRRRRLLNLLSGACVLVTGCSLQRPPPLIRNNVVDTVTSGFDAYRAGDQTALESDIQKLSNLLPTDETDTVFIGCSSQGYKLRRIERAKRDLEYLDASPAPSMEQEEKYIYFQQLVGSGTPPLDENGHVVFGGQDTNDPLRNSNAPSDFECEGASDYQQSKTLDTQEDDAIQAAGRDRLRAWLIDLRRSYGPDLDARMQNAANEVFQFKLTPFEASWRPPSADAPKIWR